MYVNTAALLITFSTYGSRLHGDPRGSRRRVYGVDRDRAGPPNPALAAWERKVMREAPFALDATARLAVADAIVEACRFHGWHLIAQTVQYEHVHVVVCPQGQPSEVLRVLKARATTVLRERGLLGARQRVWTRSGSVITLATPAAIERAAAYVDAHPH